MYDDAIVQAWFGNHKKSIRRTLDGGAHKKVEK